MTFQEILPDFLAGKKIRRKSWKPESFIIKSKDLIVDQDGDEVDSILSKSVLSTNWELYKEPAPEPAEKTLEEFVYNLVNSNDLISLNCHIAAFYQLVSAIESEVLRRNRENLPKVEGKERGELFFEQDQKVWNTNGRWVELSASCKADYAKIESAFLSAYNIATPEPKPETAIDRLFNSGFEKPSIWFDLINYCRCQFKAFGKTWTGMGDTPEQAAAAAIDQFKNFIAGI